MKNRQFKPKRWMALRTETRRAIIAGYNSKVALDPIPYEYDDWALVTQVNWELGRQIASVAIALGDYKLWPPHPTKPIPDFIRAYYIIFLRPESFQPRSSQALGDL